MSIELTVRPRLQSTQYSCWWFAMAMILDYYGHHYPDPMPLGRGLSGFDGWLRPYGPLPARVIPSLGDYEAWQRGAAAEPHFIDVEEWFRTGIPNTADGMRQFRDLAGFRGVPNLPAFGHWTCAGIDAMLRAHGPVMSVGHWNRYPHAIVVMGVSDREQFVSYCDPAEGEIAGVTLAEFNSLMGRFSSFPGDALNPLYYPSSPQVRAFVAERTDPAPSSVSPSATAS